VVYYFTSTLTLTLTLTEDIIAGAGGADGVIYYTKPKYYNFKDHWA